MDVWSPAGGGIQKSLPTGLTNITRIQWSAAGFLATGADPTTGAGAVRLYSVPAWKKVYATNYYCLAGLAFNPAGSTLAVAGCDGHVTAVSTATGKAVDRPEKDAHPGGDYGLSISFSADGKSLFVDDDGKGFEELDPMTLRSRSLQPRPPEGQCWDISRDGALRAMTQEDGTLAVLETRGAAKPRALTTYTDVKCKSIAWLDATELVILLSNGALDLWDIKGNGSRRELAPAAADDLVKVSWITAAPTGGTFVSVDASGAIAVWDVAAGARRELHRPPPAKGAKGPELPSIEWAPGRERFAALYGDHVTEWDGRSGNRLG